MGGATTVISARLKREPDDAPTFLIRGSELAIRMVEVSMVTLDSPRCVVEDEDLESRPSSYRSQANLAPGTPTSKRQSRCLRPGT